jgi:two-component system response regulator HydG
MLKLHLEDTGYCTSEAINGQDAINKIKARDYDTVLLDMKMDVMDGITFLKEIRKSGNDIPVIVITASTNVKTAVSAMKLGATDFLSKPVDVDELKSLIESVFAEQGKPNSENIDFKFDGIYSEEGLGRIIEDLKMVAPSETTVLILGESGTGKELIAKAIHDNSDRSHKPFIAVNSAAFNENLIESELFGYEKGAFTGAHAQTKGKFELADGGTLFLDEIGELPLHFQAKFLRVIQEKTFERLGGSKVLKSDFRIIAATNKNLEQMVKDKTFREDLYFRINVFPVNISPLRERKNEISLLTTHFINKYATRNHKTIKGASSDFLDKLYNYDFPGNIRELENFIERSVILTKSERLDGSLLPNIASLSDKATKTPIRSALDIKNNQKQLILQALEETSWHQSKAADILGISRRTLHNKLKEFNISKK